MKNKIALTNFAAWLVDFRAQLGLTQTKLAELCELNVRTIKKWESASTSTCPTNVSIDKLALGLGLSNAQMQVIWSGLGFEKGKR